MGLKIIAQPTGELLTIDECRQHLNVQPYEIDSDGVGTHPDDAQIMAMLSAARAYCENFLGLSIAQRTYELTLDQFPVGPISVTLSPLVTVESVTVGEGSDALLDPETYLVDDYSVPALLLPLPVWPSVTAATNLIRIRYVAGYGSGSDDVPLPWEIRAAMLLMLGHFYANREAVNIGNITSDIPFGVDALLRPLRVRLGMA